MSPGDGWGAGGGASRHDAVKHTRTTVEISFFDIRSNIYHSPSTMYIFRLRTYIEAHEFPATQESVRTDTGRSVAG